MSTVHARLHTAGEGRADFQNALNAHWSATVSVASFTSAARIACDRLSPSRVVVLLFRSAGAGGANVLHGFLFLHLVPIRRLNAQQVMDEEVLEHSLAKGASCTMPASGNEKQIEFLVGFDQRVNDLQASKPDRR